MKRKSISDTDNSIHGNNKEETTIEKGFWEPERTHWQKKCQGDWAKIRLNTIG